MSETTPVARMNDDTVRLPTVPPSRRRRRTGLRLTVAAGVVVLLAAAGATVQANRTPPLPTFTADVPASLTIPGAAPKLPWPTAGQSAVEVLGLGSLADGRPVASVPIGSVAKVMTAYLVLTDHPLDVGQPGPSIRVTAADVADYHARIPSGQSLVEVVEGEMITERQALQALMLPSANNVAALLARWDAGTPDAFVARMNSTAEQLGLTGSHYTDPSGFAPQTVSTAADQILLAERALALPAFAEIVAMPSATLPVVGLVHNYNTLLGVDGVFGVKTGSTDEAGGNLVFAAHLTVEGRTLTVVGAVFNQPGADTPRQLAKVNTATRQLLAGLRQTVRAYTVLPVGSRVGQVHPAWAAATPVGTATEVRLVGWPGLRVTLALSPVPPHHTVRTSDDLGRLSAKLGDQTATTAVRAQQDVIGPSLWWRLRRTG